jgi:hypothetical protein
MIEINGVISLGHSVASLLHIMIRFCFTFLCGGGGFSTYLLLPDATHFQFSADTFRASVVGILLDKNSRNSA